jgi:energy-converting hydrogenase Eha subunit G
MKLKTLSFVAMLPLLAGCAASLHTVTVAARPKISPAKVKCYDGMPSGAEIVGTMHVQNISGFSHYFLHPEKRQMINAAAFMGANGLVIGPDSVQLIVGYQVDATAIFVP